MDVLSLVGTSTSFATVAMAIVVLLYKCLKDRKIKFSSLCCSFTVGGVSSNDSSSNSQSENSTQITMVEEPPSQPEVHIPVQSTPPVLPNIRKPPLSSRKKGKGTRRQSQDITDRPSTWNPATHTSGTSLARRGSFPGNSDSKPHQPIYHVKPELVQPKP